MTGRQAPRFTLQDVLTATGGALVRRGRADVFDGVSTDSRTLAAGSLFVPLRGPRFDGHDFLAQAAAAGAAGVLVERGREGLLHGIGAGTAAVAVADTLRALGDLARLWRSRFDIPVVAVTGSTGKTTTKEAMALPWRLRISCIPGRTPAA